jgi:hypothetical protein
MAAPFTWSAHLISHRSVTDDHIPTLSLPVLRPTHTHLAVVVEDSTACVGRGARVYRRTEAQTSLADPPFVHVRLSNHSAMRMECPLIAAALQTSEVVWVKTRPR